ncbi:MULTISPECIES: polyketide cyclase [Tenuifilum]|uniref:Polyketide cyclase n=1 Tax=Tenuifilum thalassicum TaxID=2590900 RepID=A0A7D4BDK6_9BACT|nr:MULTISPECIES: polyketide cyclase [Tenuifilum]QKG79398.1 polyketide cyclase [Tenuifilum thalassicum]
MTTYESKIVAVKKRAEDIFRVLADFRNFSPIAQDKLENWSANEDSCSFSYKGMGPFGIKIIEREEFKTIKFTGDEKLPMQFFMWIQLKEVAPYDTRLKITVKAELNMMMKMMVGKKLQEGIDALADGIATAFNAL